MTGLSEGSPRVRLYGPNTQGRDFVVGDIHGAFHLLHQAMLETGFIPGVDRIFSLGDLIDRGDESRQVADVLQIPGFNAVLGNHEAMLLDFVEECGIESNDLFAIHLRNGLGWWKEVALPERRRIVEALKKLPIAIQVNTPRGRVGLVHADVPEGMDWPEFLRALSQRDQYAEHCALWSRERVQNSNTNGVVGIDRVMVGHTPMVDGVQRLGNVYFVDTAAVFAVQRGVPDMGLTFANLCVSTTMLDHSRPGVDMLNILDASPQSSRPFSEYALKVATP